MVKHYPKKDLKLSDGNIWHYLVFDKEPDLSMYPEEYYDRRTIKRRPDIIYYVHPNLFTFLLLKFDIERKD